MNSELFLSTIMRDLSTDAMRRIEENVWLRLSSPLRASEGMVDCLVAIGQHLIPNADSNEAFGRCREWLESRFSGGFSGFQFRFAEDPAAARLAALQIATLALIEERKTQLIERTLSYLEAQDWNTRHSVTSAFRDRYAPSLVGVDARSVVPILCELILAQTQVRNVIAATSDDSGVHWQDCFSSL